MTTVRAFFALALIVLVVPAHGQWGEEQDGTRFRPNVDARLVYLELMLARHQRHRDTEWHAGRCEFAQAAADHLASLPKLPVIKEDDLLVASGDDFRRVMQQWFRQRKSRAAILAREEFGVGVARDTTGNCVIVLCWNH